MLAQYVGPKPALVVAAGAIPFLEKNDVECTVAHHFLERITGIISMDTGRGRRKNRDRIWCD
jgi:hypothetical protein